MNGFLKIDHSVRMYAATLPGSTGWALLEFLARVTLRNKSVRVEDIMIALQICERSAKRAILNLKNLDIIVATDATGLAHTLRQDWRTHCDRIDAHIATGLSEVHAKNTVQHAKNDLLKEEERSRKKKKEVEVRETIQKPLPPPVFANESNESVIKKPNGGKTSFEIIQKLKSYSFEHFLISRFYPLANGTALEPLAEIMDNLGETGINALARWSKIFKGNLEQIIIDVARDLKIYAPDAILNALEGTLRDCDGRSPWRLYKYKLEHSSVPPGTPKADIKIKNATAEIIQKMLEDANLPNADWAAA